jgi:hypothetical protein
MRFFLNGLVLGGWSHVSGRYGVAFRIVASASSLIKITFLEPHSKRIQQWFLNIFGFRADWIQLKRIHAIVKGVHVAFHQIFVAKNQD